MSKPVGPGRIGSARRFLQVFSELVDFLPSVEEKRDMQESLKALISYLQNAQRDLEQLPTRDDMDQLSVALKRVEMLLGRAEDNPLISRAFGIEQKRSRKVKQVSPQASERTKYILSELERLTIDQMRDALSRDPKYTTNDLREIAVILGVRANSRVSRETLANQVTVRIANKRGYESLGGMKEEKPASNGELEKP
ncbi:MAG TPA: hypothetical protein PKH03_00040 [Syntrophales bacterium]|nr:hypothetical protein [Syntrophales bacterium]